jgi:hypothetical protein
MLIFRLTLLIVVPLFAPVVSADCIKDIRGEVYCGAGQCLVDRTGKAWCSRFYEGGARKTLEGQVLCGKGQCVKNRDGEILCSTEVGGAALIDNRGIARCYGQCELASEAMCENTPAGR